MNPTRRERRAAERENNRSERKARRNHSLLGRVILPTALLASSAIAGASYWAYDHFWQQPEFHLATGSLANQISDYDRQLVTAPGLELKVNQEIIKAMAMHTALILDLIVDQMSLWVGFMTSQIKNM